jgi:hypothetical protein
MNVLEESASSDIRAGLYILRSPKFYQLGFDDREGETWENTENCMKSSCTICTITEYYSDVILKKDEMGGSCSTHSGT